MHVLLSCYWLFLIMWKSDVHQKGSYYMISMCFSGVLYVCAIFYGDSKKAIYLEQKNDL